ncbi:MAG TPA: nitroreductase family protein [Candidatus Acidoferrum sp.]|nr:nitroreductase family protein [Candidatus Acidoferrum sp.]
MNEVIQNLHTRKSVRVFEDREIPQDVKREILLAAAQAPTAGNQQLYTILDIMDQQLKDRLAVTCDNQPFIAKAPMVLIFCADAQKWYDVYLEGGCTPRKPGAGDFVLAVVDACIAAQNAVTAAWSLGVGSCYIGDIMEQCEEHRELLKLPEYVFPAAMLIFGYPMAQQLGRKKPQRCELSHIVHENAYRRMAGSELRGMLAHETEGTPFEDWCRAFCERKYNSDFSKEMSRSVAEYLKAYRQ